ncbi:hypothetical protein GGI1_16729, partial [Acidithiobacillus sp. GGI-221]
SPFFSGLWGPNADMQVIGDFPLSSSQRIYDHGFISIRENGCHIAFCQYPVIRHQYRESHILNAAPLFAETTVQRVPNAKITGKSFPVRLGHKGAQTPKQILLSG